jgi:hypothetical protein
MKTNKVSYRIIDKKGWSGWPSLEAYAQFRASLKEEDKVPVTRILKITEEELDEGEVIEFKKKIGDWNVENF